MNDSRPPSGDYGDRLGVSDPRNFLIQIVLSVALGLGAFIAFCVSRCRGRVPGRKLTEYKILRPRWTGLYAARKQQNKEAAHLPELPNTMFGWLPVLWKINDQQILASAGLDAYVVCTNHSSRLTMLIISIVPRLLSHGNQVSGCHVLLRPRRAEACPRRLSCPEKQFQ